MKIAICIPHNYSHFEKAFVISLSEIIVYTNWWATQTKRAVDISVLFQDGLKLDAMRNSLVEICLQNNQTHVLFLDTDMSFPREIIRRMVEDFEDNPTVEAITGLYTWKRPPFVPHVYSKYNEKAGQFPMDKLFRVEGAGTGCLMVKTEVFKRTKAPWFLFEEDKDNPSKMKMGEDLYFCKKVKPIMLCDPRIICEHYTTKAYSIKDYFRFNKIKQRKDKNFTVTKKQIESITKIHTGKLS